MTQTNAAVGGNFTWLGIALIVLGIAAILTPAAAGGAVVVVIGLILLAAGVAAALRGLQAATALEKVLGLAVGIVTALAGVAVLAHPLFGLSLLTLLLAGYFLVDGACKIVVSFRFRPASGWLWLLFSGGVSLVLGVLIWSQWPMSGLWAVGILVGLNLMSTGFALLKSVSMLRGIAARERPGTAAPIGMKTLVAAFVAVTLAFGATGVSPTADAKEKLPETTPEGLKLVPKTKVSAVYLRDGASFGGYTKVAILDCYVAFKKNWKREQNQGVDSFKVSDDDITRIKTELADELKKVWTKELTAKGQTVVTTAGPDVLILRPAIVNLDVEAPDTRQPGITHTFSASAGQATLFLELYDSVTSELLARIFDAEEAGGMGFITVRNSVTNRADADRMLKKWADLLGTRLQDARASAAAAAE